MKNRMSNYIYKDTYKFMNICNIIIILKFININQ